MKIRFPKAQDGWVKLGELIFAKSKNLGDEPPLNEADADVKKVGELSESAKKKLDEAAQSHRDAENFNEQADKDLVALEHEIRRVVKVLSGRYQDDKKSLGAWGIDVDESSPGDPVPGTDPPPPAP